MEAVDFINMITENLFPTLLARHILLRMLKRWNGGYRKYIFANALSLFFILLCAGINLNNFLWYSLPQLFWLGYDFFQYTKRQKLLNTSFAGA